MKTLLYFLLLSLAIPAFGQYPNTPCGETVPRWFLSDRQAQWRMTIHLKNQDSTEYDSAAILENIFRYIEKDSNAKYVKYTSPELAFMLTNFVIERSPSEHETKEEKKDNMTGNLQFQVSILFESKKLSVSITDIHMYGAIFDQQAYNTYVSYGYSNIRSMIFKDKGCLKGNSKGNTTRFLKDMDKAFLSYFDNLGL